MSDFSDNANKRLADGYLRVWPSVGELAPVRCCKESSSHTRKQGVRAVFVWLGRPLWEGPLEQSPESVRGQRHKRLLSGPVFGSSQVLSQKNWICSWDLKMAGGQ